VAQVLKINDTRKVGARPDRLSNFGNYWSFKQYLCRKRGSAHQKKHVIFKKHDFWDEWLNGHIFEQVGTVTVAF